MTQVRQSSARWATFWETSKATKVNDIFWRKMDIMQNASHRWRKTSTSFKLPWGTFSKTTLARSRGRVFECLATETLIFFSKVVEESRNAKEMMGWLEGKIKECKVRIAAEGFVFKPEDICDYAFNWFPSGWVHWKNSRDCPCGKRTGDSQMTNFKSFLSYRRPVSTKNCHQCSFSSDVNTSQSSWKWKQRRAGPKIDSRWWTTCWTRCRRKCEKFIKMMWWW